MPVIVSDPEILSGTPCFKGTRVPLQNFVDYLEGGDTIDVVLDQFPSVRRDQAAEALEEMKQALRHKVEQPA